VESRDPKDVIEELMRRTSARDFAVIDELIAEDMVNHAAGGENDTRGPQGREGWKRIVAMMDTISATRSLSITTMYSLKETLSSIT